MITLSLSISLYLDLGINKLSTLEGLGKLNNLYSLDLEHNKLTDLPNEVFNLEKLERLFVNDNSIPLSSIKQFDLKENGLGEKKEVNLFYTRNHVFNKKG